MPPPSVGTVKVEGGGIVLHAFVGQIRFLVGDEAAYVQVVMPHELPEEEPDEVEQVISVDDGRVMRAKTTIPHSARRRPPPLYGGVELRVPVTTEKREQFLRDYTPGTRITIRIER